MYSSIPIDDIPPEGAMDITLSSKLLDDSAPRIQRSKFMKRTSIPQHPQIDESPLSLGVREEIPIRIR